MLQLREGHPARGEQRDARVIGKDLRCPECSSFAVDVDPDFDLSRCLELMWTCECGHVVMSTLEPTVVVKQAVVRRKKVDPPKAEGAGS